MTVKGKKNNLTFTLELSDIPTNTIVGNTTQLGIVLKVGSHINNTNST